MHSHTGTDGHVRTYANAGAHANTYRGADANTYRGADANTY